MSDSLIIEIDNISITLSPTLDLIEKLEKKFGTLHEILHAMRQGHFPAKNHTALMIDVYKAHRQKISKQNIENLIAEKGLIALSHINVKIIAVCLAGLSALESFFEEVPPSLGKL